MDRLSRYTALWEQQEKALRTATGFRHVEKDLNVQPPLTWHFGPPPAGWGSFLAKPMALRGLGAAAYGATIGLDPTREPRSSDPNYVKVSTVWAQRALNGLGVPSPLLQVDGRAGPLTMAALREAQARTASTRTPAQVIGAGETANTASHVAIDARTEAWLMDAPVVPDPPRPSGSALPDVIPGPVTFEPTSSGGGSSGLLTLLGFGIVGFIAYKAARG